MSVFVLDCSVATAWLFEDEATPETDALLDQLADGAALVPLHWRLELGNVLVQAERRRRIAPPQVAASVDFVASLPIEVDAETDRRSFREVFSLARSASLTTYDAAYLELALRSGLALATLDKALVQAARDLQVKTLPRTIR